jgi:hypothetical protein
MAGCDFPRSARNLKSQPLQLNKLPKSVQPKAKTALQSIWMAETRNDADAAFDHFIELYETKYD